MRLELDDPRLMDYVLGELEDGEALTVAAALEQEENKAARELVEELRGVTEMTRRILHEDDGEMALSDEQRAAIVGTVGVPTNVVRIKKSKSYFTEMLVAAAAIIILAAIAIPNTQRYIARDMLAESSEPKVFQTQLVQGEAASTKSAPTERLSAGRYIEPQHMLPQHTESEVLSEPTSNSDDGVGASTDGLPTPPFEWTDPESSGVDTTQLTLEERRQFRAEEFNKYGKLYQENDLPDQAETIYSHVLELDPNNQEAKDSLEQASKTKAAESPEVRQARAIAADSDRIQRVDNDGDGLRAGADAKGIKQDFQTPPSEESDAFSNRLGEAAVPEEAPTLEARNRLEMKANLRDGLSLSYENGAERPDHSAAKPAEEQWAEYNVGNLTGQSELPEQVASNRDLNVELQLGEPRNNNLWQWNGPEGKPTEIVGGPGTETYVKVAGVKPFVAVKDEPLSTFSIDVDTAAYSNVRRFLSQGQLPPADAVRIEEMINYFAYNYLKPSDGTPFAVSLGGAPAPWAPERLLVRIGVKGKEVPASERPPANLVFLLDVSGSMGDANKLPLVKESMKTLLSQLRPNDRVGIVTYAGDARLVLGSTPCSEGAAITQAIESLQSGGSTNGGGGIQMAYDLAQSNFIHEGINRVILATDGDFNVGTTAHGDLMSMIEARAKSGVFLTTLGFGMGNLKDSTLEQLADRGNGNYAYIDNHAEARKALVDQLSGTLQTIAKDVKIQVEFNPAKVSHYRLLGYENRALAAQDFNDDTKDAGEIGAGHTVTALYEIIPVGASPVTGVDALKYQSTSPDGVAVPGDAAVPSVDPLRYQGGVAPQAPASPAPLKGEERIAPDPMPLPAGDWLTVKIRYKQPEGNESSKIEVPLMAMNGDLREADPDFRFASAVAAFGQVLRNSGYRHPSNFDRIIELARGAANGDTDREAFVDLVITAKTLSAQNR